MKMLKTIERNIKKNKKFLISTHVNPDLDALCSELAMAAYLRSLGKIVYIVNQDPVPAAYYFLQGASKIKALPKKKLHYDVAMVFDCGELNRIGRVVKMIDGDKPLINIDHHVTNTFFGSCNLVKPKASSTAEVLFDLFHSLGVSLTKPIARFLYLGILTDTGSFRYETTTAHTHRVAATLLGYGLSVNALYQQVYARLTSQDLKVFLRLASKFELFLKGKVIFLSLDPKALAQVKGRFDLRDHLFRTFRSMQQTDVIVIFTPSGPQHTRINFRSAGRINVAKVAMHFQGGGHKNASGCQMSVDVKTARKKILQVLKGHF